MEQELTLARRFLIKSLCHWRVPGYISLSNQKQQKAEGAIHSDLFRLGGGKNNFGKSRHRVLAKSSA